MKYFANIIVIGILLLAVSCAAPEENKTTEEAVETTENKNSEAIPVAIQQVQHETFDHFIEVSGSVEAEQYAFVSPENSGQIKEILVTEGQRVRKGDVMIKLNTIGFDGQIKQVKSQLELATTTFEKQDKLWNEEKVGSEMQYLQAKTQRESLEAELRGLQARMGMSIIKAPFSGIIEKINLKVGELASPGMQLIELVNLDRMKITSNVSERLLPVVHKNDSVLISFPTYKDFHMKAPIYRTGNMINPANRTFTIELRVKNQDHLLKPFMVSTLKIKDYSLENAITVPSIIVKKDFDKEFIFIASKTDSNLVAKKVYVETGRSYKDRTVISKGLNINDQVIVKGYNTVSTGVAIKVINN